MDAQVPGIAGTAGFVNIMTVYQKQVPRACMKCRMTELARHLSPGKEQQLHRLMPVGRHIGACLLHMDHTEAGVVQICQLFMVVILQIYSPFPKFFGS
jgi:hypothetical protein